MASIVERRTAPTKTAPKGDRRLYVKFRAFDRKQGRERVVWELQPPGTGKKEAQHRSEAIGVLLRDHGGRWPFPDTMQEAGNLTMSAYLEDWLVRRASSDASERVVDLYRHNLRTHVMPEIGTTTLAELRRRHLNELVQGLYEKNLARNTIKNVIAPLTKALNTAVDDELILANPAARLEMPKRARERKARVPSPAELKNILSKATPDARDVIVTIAGLGLRRGEALALRWCDIDFKTGLVHVRRQNIRGRIEDRTKTPAGTRVVPLFPTVRAALEARAKRLGGPVQWLAKDERLLFANAIGGPVEPTNFYRREWLPAVKAAGFSDLHLHDLRHFAATRLNELGMPDKLRTTIIGHANENVTNSLYTHIDAERVARAATQYDPLGAVGS